MHGVPVTGTHTQATCMHGILGMAGTPTKANIKNNGAGILISDPVLLGRALRAKRCHLWQLLQELIVISSAGLVCALEWHEIECSWYRLWLKHIDT